jgi:hypothetical protein
MTYSASVRKQGNYHLGNVKKKLQKDKSGDRGTVMIQVICQDAGIARLRKKGQKQEELQNCQAPRELYSTVRIQDSCQD